MPTLRELLKELPCARLAGDPDTAVAAIAYDSRLVKEGDLFVALPGFHSDGAAFIPDALRRGAAAVVTQNSEAQIVEGTAWLQVPDARRALTDLSAAFHGYPARHLLVIGVTGTDGKTTTTHLVSATLEAMGRKTGFVTTADLKVGDRVWYNDTQHTTPESVEVQGLMRQMVEEGVDYAVLESSSHALALDRLLHCEFDAAVFTNLSPEHLNFHGSMENYLRDKSRLFAFLDGSMPKGAEKVAVLNADDPRAPQLRAATRARAIWYGLNPQSSVLSPRDWLVTAADLRLLPGGSRFTLVTPVGSAEVETRLSGRFNVYNWLAAAAVGLSQGASLEQIRQAMALVEAVPGRMQRIVCGQPFAVVVDFAHTPQALQTVLGTLRPMTTGKLYVLFGQAGERDPGNRAEMGRVAARDADFALFTMDDPRFEDPMEIAEQIAVGARAEGWREREEYLKIADREEAIREVFRRAGAGDTVLLAGKGHEQRQVIGDRLLPWNDAEAARRILRELFGGA
ncbi:MAG: UDP-N-acetylmuramoyl-L-alanyl-D-glutamate--2,6-diaminopimelate ligase [Chloroflexota bacterium]